MRKGCINRYNVERGFGWIKVKGQLLLEFFHISQWNGGNNVPLIGQMVEFEIGPDRKGRMQAMAVTPIEPTDAAVVAPEIAQIYLSPSSIREDGSQVTVQDFFNAIKKGGQAGAL